MPTPSTNKRKLKKNDLPDSQKDREQLQPDEGTLELPEVGDIPGQEHIRPFLPGEMADTTISSADEEGTDLLDSDESIMEQNDYNVTREERELLAQSDISMGSEDDLSLKKAMVDTEDEEGVPLNEKAEQSGDDLDVPGSEADDDTEITGNEDEENNSFSLNDEKEDNINNQG